MKKKERYIMRWIIVWSVSCLLGFPGMAPAVDLTPRQVYEQASPSVVYVLAMFPDGSGIVGAGSIIRSDGVILTNAHVVMDMNSGTSAERLLVFLKPGQVTGNRAGDLTRQLQASLLTASRELDLALLQLHDPPRDLVPIAVGDSADVRIGEPVLAIGHPEQGGRWSLTRGVISAVLEDFHGQSGNHVFQTDEIGRAHV